MVGEELHFTRAADRLFISQPALSKQIKELEEELGFVLLDRDNRNVRLTRAGEYLMQQAIYLEDKLADVIRNVRHIGRGEQGELKIGFVGSAMHSVIPGALVKLNQRFPGIHTSLQEEGNRALIEAILRDRLDAGFVRTEHFSEDLSHKMVWEEHFVLVVAEDHWLTSRKLQDIAQLRDEKFILFGSGYSQDYYDLILSIFSDHDIKPIISHRSVHAMSIFRLVESKLGVAIVPQSLTTGFNLKIRMVPLDKIRQKTRLHLIWKKGSSDGLLTNFIDLF